MGTPKVPICNKMQKEKYFLRKERDSNPRYLSVR